MILITRIAPGTRVGKLNQSRVNGGSNYDSLKLVRGKLDRESRGIPRETGKRWLRRMEPGTSERTV
jgi:hypothetical protein